MVSGRFSIFHALVALLVAGAPLHAAVAQQAWQLNREAVAAAEAGRLEAALKLAREAHAMGRTTLAPGQRKEVAGNLANIALALGVGHMKELRLAAAAELLGEGLRYQEEALGPDHAEVAQTLTVLGGVQMDRGETAAAETAWRRALAMREAAFGPNDPRIAALLGNLGALYRVRNQLAQAEAFYLRAIEIEQSRGPAGRMELASRMGMLGELYLEADPKKAEPILREVLALQEAQVPPPAGEIAATLNNLASLYSNSGRHSQAEPLLRRALASWQSTLGPEHPHVASALNNLALLALRQGDPARAHPLFRQAMAIREKVYGPGHPDVEASLANMAGTHDAQGDLAAALPLLRQANALHRERLLAGGVTADAARGTRMGQLWAHFRMLQANPLNELPAALSDEAFQLAQLVQATGTSAALAGMAARFAAGSDELAVLVRAKQEAAARREKAEAELVAAAARPPASRRPQDEARLRETATSAAVQAASADAELARRFPKFKELANPQPLALREAQALLRPEEAMLIYVLGGDRSWMWVVRREASHFVPLKADYNFFARRVTGIRESLDFDRHGKPREVDLEALHNLYRNAVEPAAPFLADAKHLMVVPDGPLQSLPLGMLVASDPGTASGAAAYAKADWLAARHAISVLPSVTSLRALRQIARPAPGRKAYIGFGDPVIGSGQAATRQVKAALVPSRLFRSAGGSEENRSEVADVDLIRKAPRLPETADEIRAMAGIMKAGTDSVWLQDKATEKNVKALDLSQYRVIAFATHGLMAGEIQAGMEPGLLLTPPREGTREDDGYLTSSEVARLDLRAELVLLSACNTAAPDGTPGAEGLSGLSKAFFHAGTRSLLASHWPVASEATVPLTTRMLAEYEKNPGAGRAEAHRKATLALMATPGHPEYAHPIFWAPFVLVGEGGAGDANSRP